MNDIFSLSLVVFEVILYTWSLHRSYFSLYFLFSEDLWLCFFLNYCLLIVITYAGFGSPNLRLFQFKTSWSTTAIIIFSFFYINIGVLYLIVFLYLLALCNLYILNLCKVDCKKAFGCHRCRLFTVWYYCNVGWLHLYISSPLVYSSNLVLTLTLACINHQVLLSEHRSVRK